MEPAFGATTPRAESSGDKRRQVPDWSIWGRTIADARAQPQGLEHPGKEDKKPRTGSSEADKEEGTTTQVLDHPGNGGQRKEKKEAQPEEGAGKLKRTRGRQWGKRTEEEEAQRQKEAALDWINRGESRRSWARSWAGKSNHDWTDSRRRNHPPQHWNIQGNPADSGGRTCGERGSTATKKRKRGGGSLTGACGEGHERPGRGHQGLCSSVPEATTSLGKTGREEDQLRLWHTSLPRTLHPGSPCSHTPVRGGQEMEGTTVFVLTLLVHQRECRLRLVTVPRSRGGTNLWGGNRSDIGVPHKVRTAVQPLRGTVV